MVDELTFQPGDRVVLVERYDCAKAGDPVPEIALVGATGTVLRPASNYYGSDHTYVAWDALNPACTVAGDTRDRNVRTRCLARIADLLDVDVRDPEELERWLTS